MEEKIEDAITKMAEQTKACNDSSKALHFSQAAYNLANTLAIVKANERKKAASAK